MAVWTKDRECLIDARRGHYLSQRLALAFWRLKACATESLETLRQDGPELSFPTFWSCPLSPGFEVAQATSVGNIYLRSPRLADGYFSGYSCTSVTKYAHARHFADPTNNTNPRPLIRPRQYASISAQRATTSPGSRNIRDKLPRWLIAVAFLGHLADTRPDRTKPKRRIPVLQDARAEPTYHRIFDPTMIPDDYNNTDGEPRRDLR
ncbi:hypothetical protein C8J57DRAFT_1635619 [Mycena rebaudengoi]|nr:hypothetical protein C8J57DRAFT_1635619 [Mycena rebaudengoi]